MNLPKFGTISYPFLFLLGISLFAPGITYSQDDMDSMAIEIPVGGNSWLIHPAPGEEITESGLQHWKSASTICRTFFRAVSAGQIHIWLFIENADTASIVELRIGSRSRKIELAAGHGNRVDAGEWTLPDSGYVKLDLRGLLRKDSSFGKLTTIRVEGRPVSQSASYVQNNDDNYFYWGRRGPSVHLNFKVDSSLKVSWFYNEITVPAGNDVIGSYFMANGFAEGYFGIQVNSKTERRVLFSIWSPFHTDDPETVPDSLRIKLLAKGSGVYTGEFGNEGTGGQSYLKYNWKAGTTYGFLTHAQLNPGNTTTFTSWFYAPETKGWKLIASFQRPSTSTSLKRLHSFLENFEPEAGLYTRKVLFSRQFVADESGHWQELNTASFSIDQTGRKNFRKDYFGSVAGKAFMLQNCGFFNKYELPGTQLTRPASINPPAIDFASLPRH